MHNTKQRVLINKKLLTKLASLAGQGVPVSRLIRDNNLGISQPVLSKLIQCYNMSVNHSDNGIRHAVNFSIFPDWLDKSKTTQNPPRNYSYEGMFPFGYWVEHK